MKLFAPKATKTIYSTIYSTSVHTADIWFNPLYLLLTLLMQVTDLGGWEGVGLGMYEG